MGNKDIISKELIKEIGCDISMHILGIELEDEITLIDKEWTRVEKRDSDTEYKNFLEKVTILSTNRDLEKNVKQGAKMLTVDVKKIPFYQDGLKDGIREGIREGIQKGIQSGVEKVAISMLKLNVDLDIIQKATGLTVEEIEKLRQKI